MSENQPQADEVFDEALHRAAGPDRARYLDEACGGDLELRRRVERLLKAVSEAGSFLERPAEDPCPTVDPAPVEHPGTVVGPYKLLEQIGEGGMGAVWMAEQTEPIQRRVALKVIKEGMDSKQVLARFEAERQALALMEHPNIARVLDAGKTPSGRPYFVMELVKGRPITAYCDEKRLAVRERLELFGDVCRAVQHAHQKGIIHRDLKPSNVLVAPYDGKPVVKVIDFGVAKATGQRLTDKTLFTGFGALVGTPEYMSPEQAEVNNQDIDTRSDVYSLGVLLYELLTGSTPVTRKRIKEAALLEVLRVIREEEPPRPSTRLSESKDSLPSISAQRQTEPARLTQLVRGELDWIVMKALEKDRNRRYETANGFAMDVQRYKADEPVQACPPSAGYRLRKFVRRNKISVVVGAVVVLALLVALGGITGGVGWAMRDRAAQRLLVEDSGKRALDLSDEYLQKGKWQESLAEARRAESVIASGPASEDLRQRVAERLADLQMVLHLDALRTADLENPARWDPVAADKTYIPMFRDYGMDVENLDAAEAGRRLAARAIHVELALALDSWARVHMARPQVDYSRWKRLLAIARVSDGDEWRGRVREALAGLDAKRLRDLAGQAEAPEQPAATVDLLAEALSTVNEKDTAIALLRQAEKNHRDDFRINYLLGRHLGRASPDDSIRFNQAALALRPKSPGILHNLALALWAKGRLDEAIAALRESIVLRTWAVARSQGWSGSHLLLADCLMAKAQWDEAIDCYRKVLEITPTNGGAHDNLGVALRKKGLLDEAIVEHREALRISNDYASAHNNLGLALQDKGLLDQAVAEFRRAIELNPKEPGAWDWRAGVNVQLGRYSEALADYQKVLELAKDNGTAHNNLAWFLITCPESMLRDPRRAVELAKRAVELAPKEGNFFNTLGVAEYRATNWKAAIEALDKSREYRKGGDPFDYFFLAMAHWQLGQKDDARKWYKQAVQWVEKNSEALAKNPQWTEELRRFRAEAKELLNVKE